MNFRRPFLGNAERLHSDFGALCPRGMPELTSAARHGPVQCRRPPSSPGLLIWCLCATRVSYACPTVRVIQPDTSTSPRPGQQGRQGRPRQDRGCWAAWHGTSQAAGPTRGRSGQQIPPNCRNLGKTLLSSVFITVSWIGVS